MDKSYVETMYFESLSLISSWTCCLPRDSSTNFVSTHRKREETAEATTCLYKSLSMVISFAFSLRESTNNKGEKTYD